MGFTLFGGDRERSYPNWAGDLCQARRTGNGLAGSWGARRNRPDDGFAHYMECSISASAEVLQGVLTSNSTTMVDIVLRRVVGEETFRLDRGTKTRRFNKVKKGRPLSD